MTLPRALTHRPSNTVAYDPCNLHFLKILLTINPSLAKITIVRSDFLPITSVTLGMTELNIVTEIYTTLLHESGVFDREHTDAVLVLSTVSANYFNVSSLTIDYANVKK